MGSNMDSYKDALEKMKKKRITKEADTSHSAILQISEIASGAILRFSPDMTDRERLSRINKICSELLKERFEELGVL